MLWLAAFAAIPAFGQNRASADAADPNAAVPPTRYVPMPSVRAAAAPATTPAQNWKAANETVAGIDAMSLTMEMEMDAPAPQAAPAPAAQTAPAPPDAHAHHMNKGGK